jgi:hypothetical protein
LCLVGPSQHLHQPLGEERGAGDLGVDAAEQHRVCVGRDGHLVDGEALPEAVRAGRRGDLVVDLPVR